MTSKIKKNVLTTVFREQQRYSEKIVNTTAVETSEVKSSVVETPVEQNVVKQDNVQQDQKYDYLLEENRILKYHNYKIYAEVMALCEREAQMQYHLRCMQSYNFYTN